MNVNGELHATDLDVSGNAMFNSMNVNGTLNASGLDISGNAMFNTDVYIDGELHTTDLDVSGNATFNNDVYIDGELNTNNLDVSENTSLNNVVIDGNLNVVNIKFPDNTVQNTAYNPNNNISKTMPNFYGSVAFDNTTDTIYSPSFVFNNISEWSDSNHIIIEFLIFEIGLNNNQFSGYISAIPSSFSTNDVIYNLQIPATSSQYSPSLTIYKNNSINSSEHISIITTRNTNTNNSTLSFRFFKSQDQNIVKKYYISCSVKIGAINNIVNTSIENTSNNVFSSNY